MLRKGLVILVAFVVVLPLAAAREATPAPASRQATANVLLWSAHGGALGDVLADLVTRFNGTQTAVKITNEFQGDYYQTLQKFQAALAARKVPDIVMLDCMYTPFFGSTGVYASLDSLVSGTDGIDVNDLIEGFRDGDKWDGHFYAWSFARSTPLLYINVDAFKEAGLEPKVPETWTDMVAAARRLGKKDDRGQIIRYGFQLPLRNWWFVESMFRSNGGRIFDPQAGRATLDERSQLVVLQTLYDLIVKETVGYTTPDSGTGDRDFLQGKAAIRYASTANLGNTLTQAKFKVDVGFLPKWKEYAVTPGGACLAIPSLSQKKAEAWSFLKWSTSPEVTGEYSQRTGYIPLRKSAITTERMRTFYGKNPLYKVAVDQAKYAAPLPLIKAVPIVVEYFFKLQEEILVGGASVTETVKNYNKKMTDAFQEWLKDMKK